MDGTVLIQDTKFYPNNQSTSVILAICQIILKLMLQTCDLWLHRAPQGDPQPELIYKPACSISWLKAGHTKYTKHYIIPSTRGSQYNNSQKWLSISVTECAEMLVLQSSQNNMGKTINNTFLGLSWGDEGIRGLSIAKVFGDWGVRPCYPKLTLHLNQHKPIASFHMGQVCSLMG